MKPAVRRVMVSGFVSAVLTVGTLVVPGAAQAAEIDPSVFSLQRTQTDPALVDALTDTLPSRSVGEVVASANRVGTACTADASHLSASFCWQSGDNTVSYWYPQGLTTSADATDSGTVDGHEVLLSAWYDNGESGYDRGARVSFVDMSNPTAPRYRHVLLVEPTGTPASPSFTAVTAHAGGLVWYGDLLYVADTYNGMRVFDLSRMMAVSTGRDTAIGRQSDGTFHAHNYAYVLPQVGRYVPSVAGSTDPLRFSSVSLDRTSDPHALVVGEYSADGDGTRIVRFDLDSSGEVAREADGVAHGDFGWTVSFRSMQGATCVDGVYYVHRSNGFSNKGGMITWTPGEYADVLDGTVPISPEDVTYWGGRDQLWSQTEAPGKRLVFATTLSQW